MKNPRIAVSVDPDIYDTLKRISALTNQSLSKLVAELLVEVHEPLKKSLSLFEAASKASQETKDSLLPVVESTISKLSAIASDSLDQMDFLRDGFERFDPPSEHQSGTEELDTRK